MDNSDGTVTDTLTNLIWLKNASCFGAQNWATATSSTAGLSSGGCGSGGCGLSDGSTEGDWHLATLDELQKIGTNPPRSYVAGCVGGGDSITWITPDQPFYNVSTR